MSTDWYYCYDDEDFNQFDKNELWLIVWNKESNWRLILTNRQKNFEIYLIDNI